MLYYPCHCGDLITEYLVFLSDDIQHDAHIVRNITSSVRNHLQQKGVDNLIMWSDGCSAQCESKLPFFFVSESRLEWVFFGSRHGKSPCDACGAVVKVTCDEEVKNGAIIQSADNMFRHLSKTTACQRNTCPLQTAVTHCAPFT